MHHLPIYSGSPICQLKGRVSGFYYECNYPIPDFRMCIFSGCGISISMKKILTEPLVHFLLIGALLFIIFEIAGSADAGSEKTITISAGDIRMLQGNFARTWQRQPTPEELERLIEEKVRGEIASLEAVALGLDQEDPYIRRRLRMKMEMLVEDLAASVPPTDAELTAYLERNREKFTEDAQIAFSHVFLNADRRRDTLDADIAELFGRLEQAGSNPSLETYGDATMLPRSYPLTPSPLIDRQFGRGFSGQMREMKPGSWQGPVQSSYGLHLVMVAEIKPAYDPPLSAVRVQVERDFMTERRRDMLEKTYQNWAEKYPVAVEFRMEQN